MGLVRDDMLTEEDIRTKRKLMEAFSKKAPEGIAPAPVPGATPGAGPKEGVMPKPQAQIPKLEETARPKIKPPRARPDSQNKWNTETKAELMTDYMKDYRNTGKVNETASPNSKYVRKTVG